MRSGVVPTKNLLSSAKPAKVPETVESLAIRSTMVNVVPTGGV